MGARNKAKFLAGIVVLSAAIYLSAGCAAARKKKPPLPSVSAAYPSAELIAAIVSDKTITGDIVVFKDIREIDLDHDGEKEIITVFAGRQNTSGVKVIKPSRGEEESVLFEQAFLTSNTRVSVENNECLLIAESFDLEGERVIENTYRWNGKAFIKKE